MTNQKSKPVAAAASPTAADTVRVTRSQKKASEDGASPDASDPGQKQQQQQKAPEQGAEGVKRESGRVRDGRDESHSIREALHAYCKAQNTPLLKPEDGDFQYRVEWNTDRLALAEKLLVSLLTNLVEGQNSTMENLKVVRCLVDDLMKMVEPEKDRKAMAKRMQNIENEMRALREGLAKLDTEKASKAEAEAQQMRMKKELAAVEAKNQRTFADMTRLNAQSQPSPVRVGYSQAPAAPAPGLADVFWTTIPERDAETLALEKVATDMKVTNLPGNGGDIKAVKEAMQKVAESIGTSAEGRSEALAAVNLLEDASIVSRFPGQSPGTSSYFLRFKSKEERKNFTSIPVSRAFASKGVGVTWVKTPMQLRRGRAIDALYRDALKQGRDAQWVKVNGVSRLRIQNVEVTKAQIAEKHLELVTMTAGPTRQAGLGGSTHSSA